MSCFTRRLAEQSRCAVCRLGKQVLQSNRHQPRANEHFLQLRRCQTIRSFIQHNHPLDRRTPRAHRQRDGRTISPQHRRQTNIAAQVQVVRNLGRGNLDQFGQQASFAHDIVGGLVLRGQLAGVDKSDCLPRQQQPANAERWGRNPFGSHFQISPAGRIGGTAPASKPQQRRQILPRLMRHCQRIEHIRERCRLRVGLGGQKSHNAGKSPQATPKEGALHRKNRQKE